MTSLTEMAQQMVLGSDIPAREIAQRAGKKYSTLMREVNPYDLGAKLGADTLLSVMEITGDVGPLEYMAERLGCKVVSAR